jgi:hypothetical protein
VRGFLNGGDMDVLVMLEDHPDHSPVLAHVNSGPTPRRSERPPRDLVTLYGSPSPESLALALAAAVEGRRLLGEQEGVIRHLGLWPGQGAIGDAAWRDEVTGQLMTRDVIIPLDVLRDTAQQLLVDCGQMIRRLVAGLLMPDWPEGARRAIGFSLTPVAELTAASRAGVDSILDTMREADGLAFDFGD